MTCYDKIAIAIKRLTTKRPAQRPGVVRYKDLGGKMELGPITLKDGTKGDVIELYNKGCSGLFKATNGPVFTISELDLRADQSLEIDTIFAVLKELQAIGNGPDRAV